MLAMQLNYHMKLHYSQTGPRLRVCGPLLNYHMKLHYSQTQQQVYLLYQ